MKFNLVNPKFHSRPTTEKDAEQVAALLNLCSQELIGKDEFSADELRNDWQTPGFNLTSDSVMIFNDQDKFIAYGDVWGASEPYTRIYSWVRVHPDFRGLGLGTALNEWTATRAGEIAKKAPDGVQVVLNSFVNRRDKAAVDLLENLGFLPARYSWIMEIDLNREIESVSLPEGFNLRIVKKDEYDQIYQLNRDAFKDHWGYIETPFEEGYRVFLNQMVDDPFYNPDFWYVVEHQGTKVGMVINSPACSYGENYGWLHLVGVRREWRKQGLGKALILHSFNELKKAGCSFAGLSVDSQSLTGATRLYEDVGMETKEVYVRFEKMIRDGEDLRTTDLT
ncbi:MAG: hypothetical protein CL609_18830 [Anaerolineaceae bacterium]|nr:hypothetical protein [Anaerolineaceae bacterium]